MMKDQFGDLVRIVRKSHHSTEMELARIQQYRFADITRRHVRAEDAALTDRDFALKVFERWRKDADAHHGDPNE